MAAGGLAYAVDPVAVVVERHLGAVRQAVEQFRVAAGCRDDVRAQGLGVLRREGADAPGPAVHQQRLPGLQPGDVHVRDHRGRDLQQPRRGHEVDRRGRGDQLSLRDDEVLGISAAGEQRHHFVAGLPLGHAVAGRLDDSGGFQSDDVGDALRGRVVAAALQEIGAVHACGDGAHQHLPGLRGGGGGFLDVQGLNIPGLLDDDSSHDVESMRVARSLDCPSRPARRPASEIPFAGLAHICLCCGASKQQ